MALIYRPPRPTFFAGFATDFFAAVLACVFLTDVFLAGVFFFAIFLAAFFPGVFFAAFFADVFLTTFFTSTLVAPFLTAFLAGAVFKTPVTALTAELIAALMAPAASEVASNPIPTANPALSTIVSSAIFGIPFIVRCNAGMDCSGIPQ
jgi:hypothetical protein